MGAWQWFGWAIAVLLVGIVVTVVVNLVLRRLESADHPRMKASTRDHASSQAASHSAEDLSKNEWGAPG